MADRGRRPASFWTQSNALMRKNLTFQKRNMCSNVGLVLLPAFFCILIWTFQLEIDKQLNKQKSGLGSSTTALKPPTEWPPLLQIPDPYHRAVRSDDVVPFTDLPNQSCRKKGSCPVTVLFTGNNQSFGENVAGNLFSNSFSLSSSAVIMDNFADNVMGSESPLTDTIFLDFAFTSYSIYNVQRQCSPNSTFYVPVPGPSTVEEKLEVRCVQGVHLWRNSSSEVNDELYRGYRMGNSERKINEILGAYDFSNSNTQSLNVSIWYNATFKDIDMDGMGMGDLNMEGTYMLRLPRSVNLASNAYLQFSQGSGTKMLFEFVKEMPKRETVLRVDLSSALGTIFFTWVILQLFPVVLKSLVYEKQQKLRVMMKMHGLGDGPYWMISYIYFLIVSSVYMLCFVTFGSVIGIWIYVLELYPGFSLYRGLYEFGQYAFEGNYVGTDGMRWENLSDSRNGMREVLIIMVVEGFLMLFLAYYIDQVEPFGSGIYPLFSSKGKKKFSSGRMPSLQTHGSEKPDVSDERKKVGRLLLEQNTSHAIICDDLQKVYPGRDGNPEKFAVKGLSLALTRGECFGVLGPNGAGKTSFLNMMVGLTKPTSGTAYVQGLDIQTQMNEIYTSIGVCSQHDLLWETLTGREHLLFYGRLKNLKGSALKQAVEESLKSVNLFTGGVADKQTGKYSGGMKRRLSVAISLIGDPKVVYMDEPSSGLDPASRKNLWNVVKSAKQDRVIILTTHSMEEAELLCDRLGIFADGRLQCIGNSKELKARYGGSYVLTITTTQDHEQEMENLVRSLCPNASKIYHLSGTQKFELPKNELRIADVFETVEHAKSRFTVVAWGLADTTLEDVFIKVASGSST